MKIQLLNGGLANQVFQYVFARYGELSHPGEMPWYLDDSVYFISNEYNGYELEKVFGIKANLLSRAFEPDVWEEYIELKRKGFSIPQIFLDCGEDMVMYAETDDYQMTNPFSGKIYRMSPADGFYPSIVNIDEPNVYYHGNWIDKSWFNGFRKTFLNELQFPKLTSEQALMFEDKINNTYSVGVHIRRGNYVNLGIALDSSYYHDALEKIAENNSEVSLFVFSDDLYWCNQHANELGFHFAKDVTYVSGNFGVGSYIDLQLLSYCKCMVMANSGFSKLAGLLAPNLDFFIEPRSTSEIVNETNAGGAPKRMSDILPK